MKKTMQYVLYRFTTVQIVLFVYLGSSLSKQYSIVWGLSAYIVLQSCWTASTVTQNCEEIFLALHNLTGLDYHWYGRHVRFTFLGGRFLSVGTALTTRYDDDNDDDVPVVVARTA
jgi:hypothetical protein